MRRLFSRSSAIAFRRTAYYGGKFKKIKQIVLLAYLADFLQIFAKVSKFRGHTTPVPPL
ncbi:MAG: hypothetical protein IBGAMO2_140023 [Arenicellales bacterium IbO2]|nr:MAG: hypothetical protein IBGAMO2_140023 [Arenicellales bacterium IbO2]